MQDDESFIKTVASIDRNPTAKEIWNKLTPVSSTNYLGPESRIVYFKTGNVSVPLKFSREALLKNSRFEVVEFIPINPILREIAKRL